MKSIIYLCILFHLVASEEGEWAFPVIRITNSSTLIIDNMEGKMKYYNIGDSIVPEYLMNILMNKTKYNGDDNTYYESRYNMLCDTHESFVDENCRYIPIPTFGYFCPCCEILWEDFNVIPKPPFLNENLVEIYFHVYPNSMYVLRDNLYLGSRKFDTNSTYEEIYYHRTTDKPIFVTGNKCSIEGKEGVNLFIPYKSIDVTDVKKIQDVMNYMTLK